MSDGNDKQPKYTSEEVSAGSQYHQKNEILIEQQFFTILFNAANDCLAIHDDSGNIHAVNRAFLEKFHLNEKEALSHSIIRNYSVKENDPHALIRIWKTASVGIASRIPNWIVKNPKNGVEFESEIFTCPIPFEEKSLLLTRICDVSEKKRLQRDITRLNKRFEDVALMSADWIWETDKDMKLTYVSERVKDFIGYNSFEILGKSLIEVMNMPGIEPAQKKFLKIFNKRGIFLGHEETYMSKSGTLGHTVTNAVPKFNDDGEFEGYIGLVKDISKKRESDLQLKLFQKVFESALEGIFITDIREKLLTVNPAFTTITGYDKSEIVGKQLESLLSSYQIEAGFLNVIMNSLHESGSWSGELSCRKKNGEAFPEWLALSTIPDESGLPMNYLGMFHDMTEIKEKEKEIRFQALHDPLTGLPNRMLFNDRLTMAIRYSKRREARTALLFFDLDNFKNVNDSLGHTAGDLVLKETAQRVMSVIRTEDTLARLGGDEFVVILEESVNETYAAMVAERVLGCFSRAFQVIGFEFFLTASIGIALTPDDGDTVDTLIRHAYIAMYKAKDQGKNCFYSYNPELDRTISGRVTLESRMRKALERDEFFVVFQPRIKSDLSGATGMEALIRWNDSDGKIITPDQFIPVAEENGLIVPMDLMILRKACALTAPLLNCGSLAGIGSSEFRLSVNLSSKHFGRKELIPAVDEILKETGLKPENLEIEITETALMTEIDTAIEKLRRLADLGICISIDDFGTGYSSLYYLKKLPINTLKIDRSFIRDLNTDQDDAEIVATILAMARTLKMNVVAEGVETVGQVDFLRAHGCDEFQGFLFSRPISFPEVSRFLSNPVQLPFEL